MGSAVAWFLITLGALLALLPMNPSFAQHSPLCISQFALANQACAVIPSEQALRGQNRTRSQADDSEGGNDDDDDDDNDVDDDESRHKRSRGNKKSGNKNKNKNKRKKKKGGKHGGGDHDDEPRANKDCCRWLEELDESCVCGALLRLPPFLVKPTHEYRIKVGKSCKFTYNCYGI